MALMCAFDDLDTADAKAARLNAVRRNDKVEYFVKILGVEQPRSGGGIPADPPVT